MKPDFQGLMDIAKAAEEFPHIDMKRWVVHKYRGHKTLAKIYIL